MTLVEDLLRRSRPLRRRLTPRDFKETYINEALAGRASSTYVEIGVRAGESMRAVRADRKIGIDPSRSPEMAVLRPGELFYETTSDDFFFSGLASTVLEVGQVDAALIDGLHKFGQVLRDLLNLEPFMRPDGVIVLDDCNPPSRARALDVPTGGAWNGDVWKVAAFLRDERPDLRFVTVDADQGVGILTGFAGSPRTRPGKATVERYRSLDYDVLANNRRDVLHLVPKARLREILS